MPEWVDKYIEEIKKAKDDVELERIIKTIYDEGFEEGITEDEDVDIVTEPVPWEDMD